jgi:hypothetical protein
MPRFETGIQDLFGDDSLIMVVGDDVGAEPRRITADPTRLIPLPAPSPPCDFLPAPGVQLPDISRATTHFYTPTVREGRRDVWRLKSRRGGNNGMTSDCPLLTD